MNMIDVLTVNVNSRNSIQFLMDTLNDIAISVINDCENANYTQQINPPNRKEIYDKKNNSVTAYNDWYTIESNENVIFENELKILNYAKELQKYTEIYTDTNDISDWRKFLLLTKCKSLIRSIKNSYEVIGVKLPMFEHVMIRIENAKNKLVDESLKEF